MLHLIVLQTRSQFDNLLKVVSTRKKKTHKIRQLNQLDEIFNDLVLVNAITVNSTLGNETLDETNGRHEDFRKVVDSASQHQVKRSNTDDKIRDAVDSAVIVVDNCIDDAILTVWNDMVNLQAGMAVRSITRSSEKGSNSVVQNSDRLDFTGNTENTPFR